MIAAALAVLGHEIHAVDFASPRHGAGVVRADDAFQAEAITAFKKTVAGVHLIQCGFSSELRYFTALPAFRKLLKAIRPDVLLTLYCGGLGNLALFSGFRPYVVYAMGSDVLLSKGLARRLGKMAMAKAALVLANGQFLATKARELSPKAKVECLLHGVDTTTFSPEFDRLGNKVVFFNNRGFAPVYNNEFIIEALARLKKPAPDFHFHFTHLGPTLAATKRLASEILSPEIQSRLTFWGGIDQVKMLSLLRESHYFVSVSRSDGTATSLLEALSCGLFPILSDIPQNRDWVDSTKKNGMLVPLDEPEIFANVLSQALHNPKQARENALFNRGLVLERANLHQSMKVLAHRLESIARPDSIKLPRPAGSSTATGNNGRESR